MLPIRIRLDPVCFEDVADGRVGDMVADVGQGSLDAIVTLGRVLTSEPQNQVDDDLPVAWSAHRLAFAAVIPFLDNELSVPAVT